MSKSILYKVINFPKTKQNKENTNAFEIRKLTCTRMHNWFRNENMRSADSNGVWP